MSSKLYDTHGTLGEQERSVEVARRAACHYNAWTKKRKP